MTTYPIAFPNIGVRQSSFRLHSVVAATKSPTTGQQQVQVHPGQWFEGEVTFRPTVKADAGALKAWLAKLNGKEGTFLYGDPDFLAQGPQGNPAAAITSTNHIRNGNATGAVAGVVGSGGSLPTNWGVAIAAGLTTEVISSGTAANGLPYVRVKISGTPSGTNYALRCESNTQVNAALAQQWAASHYVALAAGAMTNITTLVTQVIERDSGGTSLNSSPVNFTPTAVFTRYSATRTFNQATVAKASMSLNLTLTIGLAVDITLDIGACQLEQQAAPTAYIPTTSAAVTRTSGIGVDGAGQTGNELDVYGFNNDTTIAKAGDYIQLGTGADARLYMVTDDCVSDPQGKATLQIQPRLRSSPANLAAVVFAGAKGVFRLTENDTSWDSNATSVADVSIAFVEALS